MLRAIAFSALLLTATSTATTSAVFADDGGGYALPTRPHTERVMDDGGGYASPSKAKSEALNDDGGYARPVPAKDERSMDDDGGGYARPVTANGERSMDAGDMSVPATAPADPDDGYARWS
jgi:hypothetical protein